MRMGSKVLWFFKQIVNKKNEHENNKSRNDAVPARVAKFTTVDT